MYKTPLLTPNLDPAALGLPLLALAFSPAQRAMQKQMDERLRFARTMFPAIFRAGEIMRTAFPAAAYGLDALA